MAFWPLLSLFLLLFTHKAGNLFSFIISYLVFSCKSGLEQNPLICHPAHIQQKPNLLHLPHSAGTERFGLYFILYYIVLLSNYSFWNIMCHDPYFFFRKSLIQHRIHKHHQCFNRVFEVFLSAVCRQIAVFHAKIPYRLCSGLSHPQRRIKCF